MSHPLTIERHAVELEMAQELADTKEKAEWWEAAFYQNVRREKNVTKRLYAALGYYEGADERSMEILMREHLDESPIEDDDDAESKARQILWNDSDTEKKIEAEGYDRTEVKCVPF